MSAPHSWGTAGLLLRALQVRLRFVIVLALAFLVVGKWDTIRNQAERLVRLATGSAASTSTVSNDTEYFCPMDPGVLSDWPGKCGICNMGLVRRKRGEAVLLPSGVVARMQFSPYRLQLAGVRTSLVDYQPLAREIVLVGVVGPRQSLVVEGAERELATLREDEPVELSCETDPERTIAARVRVVGAGNATIACLDTTTVLREGTQVTARLRRPVAEMEPFRSQPSDPPPLKKGEPRSIHGCPTHAEVLKLEPGKCPVDGKESLQPSALRDNQRISWWCPMHPKIQADHAGEACAECAGMKLLPRVVTFRPVGQVLAVPESAVVDTGLRTVVYVETMPGMFDGVEVVLGPRCGDHYPVVRGLEPGTRVATAGTFLIDAETRLNPALASSYFGAGRKAGPETSEPGVSETTIPAEIRSLVAAQKTCPVTKKPLGSMGTPLKVTVKGRVVLVCCEGCEGPLLKSPEKYLTGLNDANAPAPRP